MEGALPPEKQERIKGRRTKVKIRLFKLDHSKAPALDATLSAPKSEEKPSAWSSQVHIALQAARKSVQIQKNELDHVLQSYNGDEAETNQEQELGRQEVKESCTRSLAETHTAQSEQAKDWAELQGLANPLTLYTSIKEEIEKATKVLDNSSRLAFRLVKLLTERDELYAKTLRIGGDKTDKMLQLLVQQTRDLQQMCSQELEATETIFLKEQKLRDEKRRADLEVKLERQRVAEQQHVAKYVKALQSYQEQLAATFQSSSTEHEDARQAKENEVHALKQHLENMKATFTSNAELLKYNERVLKGRKPETQATIIHQKRRIADQREMLAKLKQKAAAMDAIYQEEHTKLSSEHQRRLCSIDHQLNKQKAYHRKSDCTYKEVKQLKLTVLEALKHKKILLGNMISTTILGADLVGSEDLQDAGTDGLHMPQIQAFTAEEGWYLLEQSLQEYVCMLAGSCSPGKVTTALKQVQP